MSDVLDNYREVSEELKSTYNDGTILDEWISRTISEPSSELDYYHAGKIVAEMRDDAFPPVTATNLADNLIQSEKLHIVQQIKNAAEEDVVDVNSMSDYSHNGLVEGFGDVRNPSLLVLPTKKGRPKRIHEQLNRANTVPYGAEDIDVEFVSSSEFDLERGICLSKRVDVYQVTAGEMDTPRNFSKVDGGKLSDEDDLVQVLVGESNVAETHDFLYRTMVSELTGLSSRSACMIELPD
ncbi:hypothetical protein GOC83_03655 [Haloarcula rubripromontorii]|uniref:Uncharacterized protein n=1 Tax=Haloarcula rubripromontorii TaxID=1705562 RepID=A0A847U2Z5_9EURY|nr:hypothetical protein [Haloarcula rubripromontorii]NLV05231.1 hypothetical protein [Haloarcula rubripromontorii]